MSLADLPNELIANLTGYIDYKDTCNLMETSKNYYYAIKGYKKDKIHLHSMEFFMKDDPIMFSSCIEYNEPIYLKEPVDAEDKYEYIKNVLHKCNSIQSISFPDYEHLGRAASASLTKPLIKILYETKTKIQSVTAQHSSVDLSSDEFIHFCRKFKVLTNILPHTLITQENLSWKQFDHSMALLTDRTLEALISETQLAKLFLIVKVPNMFTIKQIAKNLEILRYREDRYPFLSWHLGILRVDQLADAESLFRSEKLSEVYKIKVSRHDRKNQVEYEFREKSVSPIDEDQFFGVFFNIALE